ncbi:protein EPD1 precursor [Trichodelitschia bisporula]|uniref:1,3-beta-glucanosyltransferase n=1 Tax=Trichodelitschia bisporula TaxID=703511 RepID=A0A6G1HVD0_9PEZI|nr:protein EPD1 precursor [Trichodelitschia bisporula]
MRFTIATAVAAAALFARSVVADVDPIVIKGSKFFYKSNGTQFFIRGVAYQQDIGPSGATSDSTDYLDPLADATRCAQDIPLLKQLNTNVIRTYAVDPTKDHSKCMQLLLDNEIYIIADLGQPNLSINRDSPAWNDALYERYTAVVDMFSQYNNVIGFFAGNEVSNNKTNTNASAFVKAAVRDTKAYIKAKGYRTMYVGYATNDDAVIRENMANYFNCGDQSEAIDFWGYNIYSWCGDSSFTESGYDKRVQEFSSYSVPSFFAEYGCNTVQPRKFSEVDSLYSSDMTGVFSGGIVYMYFQEANNYGLVSVTGTKASLLPDFTALSSRLASIAPTGVNMDSYNPTNKPASCPPVQTGTWEAKSSPLPPGPNNQLCSCMYQSLQCVPSTAISEKDYGKLFGQVCGMGVKYCAGIQANALTGAYGAYSVCNSTEQLGFVLNQYYKGQNSASTACDFGGSATLKSLTTASGTCAALVSQAGAAGTGTVTGSGGSGSGTGSAKKGAAVSTVPTQSLLMGAYLVVAAGFGAGLVLL